MTPSAMKLTIAGSMLAGSLAFCPMIVAALSIIIGAREQKRREGVGESVLKRFSFAVWALVGIGFLGASVSILSLLFLLGSENLFDVTVFSFCLLVLCQVIVLISLGLLLRG